MRVFARTKLCHNQKIQSIKHLILGKRTSKRNMHNPNYTPNSTLSSDLQIQLRFTPHQQSSAFAQLRTEQKLGELIAQKTQNKEFFYGIEIAAHNFGNRQTTLNYNAFGALLPLFTSLIWFGADYAQIRSIDDVGSIKTAKFLEPHTNVLPHFTAYRVDRERLENFLNLNFTNVLAVRGDQFDPNQDFKHATELIKQMRQLRGDTISIGVGGYPDGHIDATSPEDEMEFLAQKVDAGADFIITQVCFSAETIVAFVQKCRAKGISVPIVVGVFIPENLRTLERMVEITGAQLPATHLEKYKSFCNDREKFNEFAVESAVKMIEAVFDSGLNIYGVQFFTVNRFKNVRNALSKLIAKLLPNEVE